MTRAAHIGSLIPGEVQAGQWTARCSCGWTSGAYWQEEYATRALTDHLASLPPVEEEIRTIDEWLVLALDPIKQEIAQSEEADKLFYIGARLTEIETKIEVAFGEIRARLNERLGYVTGRVKGQG
jgi:tetrahydromethanopterin S-methyltransferase subunit G